MGLPRISAHGDSSMPSSRSRNSTVVILGAIVPALLATTFFEPQPTVDDAIEDFDAAEEIDVGPPSPPHVRPGAPSAAG
jgi:hypothetical protein